MARYVWQPMAQTIITTGPDGGPVQFQNYVDTFEQRLTRLLSQSQVTLSAETEVSSD